ncbi:MAG: YwaF family protein [Bacilli bacterium]|nr:YwaF family protein [Bacilli bacterium]
MFNYNFFDYKDFIPDEYKQNVLWSLPHIIFIVVAISTIILLCVFFKNTKNKNIETYLKVLSIIIPILEVIKIVWESYWDITLGHGFNVTGLLPLYTCSMFIYVLPFAGWGKGKVKECALAFLTTLGVFAGATNFFLPPIFNDYPFFSYASFTSLNYHFLMVFTGIFIVSTRYYVPNLKSAFKAFLPVLIFSLIVIPVNYIMYLNGNKWVDYMLYMHGYGAPLLPQISDFFGKLNLRFVFTILIMGLYLGIIYLFLVIYKIVFKAFNIKQFNRFEGECHEN